jgi:hypothetical protein
MRPLRLVAAAALATLVTSVLMFVGVLVALVYGEIDARTITRWI